MGKSNAINLDPQNIRKLQLDMLKLLVEFDRICRKHKIRYFLSCGTLLGAVRHQGFIPWDDDADVEMLREDYEKFCQICETEIDSEHFFFQNHTNDVNYNWVFGKLRLKNTAYIRTGQSHLKQKTGICIDVFAIDNISSHFMIERTMEQITTLCRKLLWAPVGKKTLKNPLQRYCFKMLALIPRKIPLSLYEWIVHWYSNQKTNNLAFFNTYSRKSRGFSFDSNWYNEDIECDFEGHKFIIPNGYHELLYLNYGDYMQYPREKDQHGTSPAEYIKFSDGTELEI